MTTLLEGGKHTAGPWHLGKPDRNGKDAHMCVVMTEAAPLSEGATLGCHDIICETWSSHHMASSVRLSRAECVANARLIAAAPELLVALEDLVGCLDAEAQGVAMNATKPERIAKARAAIRKATP